MPIKYKFLSVSLGVTLASLAVFFSFTYSIFSEDKKLFALDLNLTLLKSSLSEVKLELKGRLEELQVLIPRVFQPVPGSDPFQGLSGRLSEELLGISFYQLDKTNKLKLVRRFQNKPIFRTKGLPEELLNYLDKLSPIGASVSGEQMGPQIRNRSIALNGKKEVPLGVLTFVLNGSFAGAANTGIIISADLMNDFLRRTLQQSEIAEIFLIQKEGTILAHPKPELSVRYATRAFPHPVVAKLQANQLARESQELIVDAEPYLVNTSETGFDGLYAVSQIRKEEAFLALRMLKEKSIYLALLVLSCAVVLSFLFASRLTSHIRKLKSAAEQIGRGDLDIAIDIRSRDEVQSVADSFQVMSERLKDLIEQSAQKARLEDELETARLLQSTILTPPKLSHDAVDLDFHYVPASACGGDFWDVSLRKNHLTVFIGDATGHGVPAAIVTAVAKSCLSTMRALFGSAAIQPEQVLNVLNQIVHESCQGKLLMTMCIVELNLATGELWVCNAGHDSPLCLRSNRLNETPESSDKSSKRSVDVLFARGERLGFAADSKYESVKYQLNPKETVLLFTDGISEAQNPQGREWGERSLKKAFAGGGPREIQTIRKDIVSALDKHVGGVAQADDITFVLLNWIKPYKERSALWDNVTPKNPGQEPTREENPDTGNIALVRERLVEAGTEEKEWELQSRKLLGQAPILQPVEKKVA